MLQLLAAVVCAASSPDGGVVPSSVWLDGPAAAREPLPSDPPTGPDRRFLDAARSDGGIPGPRPIHPYAEGLLHVVTADAGPAYVTISPVGADEGGRPFLSLPPLRLALPFGPGVDDASNPVPSTSSVTGMATPVTQLGRAHAAVTRQDIARSGTGNTAELVGRLASAWLERTSVTAGSPVLRGMGGSRVGILVDGFRLNHAGWGDDAYPVLATVDARAVETLEVVPGGMSEAMGGVIAISERAPEHRADLTIHSDVTAFYQSNDQGRGLRLYGEGGLGPMSVSVAGTAAEHQPFRGGRGQGIQPYTGSTPLHLQARARAAFLGQEVSAGFDGARVTRLYDNARCRPDRGAYNDCAIYDVLNRDLAWARMTVRPTAVLERVETGVAWQRQWMTLSRVDFYRVVIDRMQDDVSGPQLHARGHTPLVTLGPLAARALVGIDGQHDVVQSVFHREQMRGELGELPGLGDADPGRARLPDNAMSTSAGFHGVVEAWLVRALVLRVAGRSAVHRAWAPATSRDPGGIHRLSIVPSSGAQALVVLGDRGSWAFSLQHGYHAPNLFDLAGRAITGAGFEYAVPGHVRLEQAVTADTTLRLHAGRVATQASLFVTRWNNAPTRVRSTFEGDARRDGLDVYERRSGDDAVLTGGELWGDVHVASHIHVGGQFSYVLGQRLHSRDPIPGSPPPNGTLRISWAAPLGFHGVALCRFALPARRIAPEDRVTPLYDPAGTPQSFIFHAGGGYQLAERTAVDLHVENILDEPWRAHGSPSTMPGINARVQLRLGF